MKKVTIEVEIPDNVNIEKAYSSVGDAMALHGLRLKTGNVTHPEYRFVMSLIKQLMPKKTYTVSKYETTCSFVQVEASSVEEAIEYAKTTSGLEWEKMDGFYESVDFEAEEAKEL